MRLIPNAETRLIVAGNCRTALIPWSGFSWTDAHIPRTDKPVRFIPYLGFVYPIERLSLHRA